MILLHRLASVVRRISRRDKAEAALRSELEASSTWPPPITCATARLRRSASARGTPAWRVRTGEGASASRTPRRWTRRRRADLRYGLRSYVAIRVLDDRHCDALALGIGGITAMFSAFDAI